MDTLTLSNLIAIKEAMDKIRPVDRSQFFEQYYSELLWRIEHLQNLQNLQKWMLLFAVPAHSTIIARFALL